MCCWLGAGQEVVAPERAAEASLHIVLWGQVALQHPGERCRTRSQRRPCCVQLLGPPQRLPPQATSARLHNDQPTLPPCLPRADGSETLLGDKKAFGGAAEPLPTGTRVVVREQDTLMVVIGREDHGGWRQLAQAGLAALLRWLPALAALRADAARLCGQHARAPDPPVRSPGPQQLVLEGRSTRAFADRVEWLSRLSYLRGISSGYVEVLAHLFQEVVRGWCCWCWWCWCRALGRPATPREQGVSAGGCSAIGAPP
jgi:hypothetical protein